MSGCVKNSIGDLFRVTERVDSQTILSAYKALEPNIQWMEFPNGKQTGLQYRKGEDDPWFDAVGAWKVKKETSSSWPDENCINPFFKDTIFEEIINRYDLKRTRLLWLKPQTCYTLHEDFTPRVHIPLITNDSCFFLFESCPPIRMPVGNMYWVDTTKMHAAVNCSKEWRLHLVGAVC